MPYIVSLQFSVWIFQEITNEINDNFRFPKPLLQCITVFSLYFHLFLKKKLRCFVILIVSVKKRLSSLLNPRTKNNKIVCIKIVPVVQLIKFLGKGDKQHRCRIFYLRQSQNTLSHFSFWDILKIKYITPLCTVQVFYNTLISWVDIRVLHVFGRIFCIGIGKTVVQWHFDVSFPFHCIAHAGYSFTNAAGLLDPAELQNGGFIIAYVMAEDVTGPAGQSEIWLGPVRGHSITTWKSWGPVLYTVAL